MKCSRHLTWSVLLAMIPAIAWTAVEALALQVGSCAVRPLPAVAADICQLIQESGGLSKRAAIAALLLGGSTVWWKYLDSEFSVVPLYEPLTLQTHERALPACQ